MLNGGAGEGEVIIIAGRPAMGKTGLALNIALNLSINLKEKATLIYSLEMTKKSLADRILAMKTEINSYSLRTGSFEEFQDEIIKDAEKELSKLEVYISDESNLSVYKIRNDIKEKNLQGIKIGSVIIDYLQLMEGDSKDGNREKEVSKIMRQLKLLSLEFNIPVIVLSQLSRNLEQRSDKRPRLSDLRESGSIEQDCDIAMFVYRDEYYNNNSTQKGETEILVEKHRNGPVGTVKLFFDAQIVKFKNLEGFGHG
jgi:replicative DNA helicase